MTTPKEELRLYRIITGLMEANSVEVRYELLRAIQRHLEETTGGAREVAQAIEKALEL
jgi:hypothetical protein